MARWVEFGEEESGLFWLSLGLEELAAAATAIAITCGWPLRGGLEHRLGRGAWRGGRVLRAGAAATTRPMKSMWPAACSAGRPTGRRRLAPSRWPSSAQRDRLPAAIDSASSVMPRRSQKAIPSSMSASAACGPSYSR